MTSTSWIASAPLDGHECEERECGVSGQTYGGFVKSPDASTYDRCEAAAALPGMAPIPEVLRAEREASEIPEVAAAAV